MLVILTLWCYTKLSSESVRHFSCWHQDLNVCIVITARIENLQSSFSFFRPLLQKKNANKKVKEKCIKKKKNKTKGERLCSVFLTGFTISSPAILKLLSVAFPQYKHPVALAGRNGAFLKGSRQKWFKDGCSDWNNSQIYLLPPPWLAAHKCCKGK